jgi:hypothetical protein
MKKHSSFYNLIKIKRLSKKLSNFFLKKLIFCKKARHFLHDISSLQRCQILRFKLLMSRHIRCIVQKRVTFKMMRSLFNIIQFCLYCFFSSITFNDIFSSFSMLFNRFRAKKIKFMKSFSTFFHRKLSLFSYRFSSLIS